MPDLFDNARDCEARETEAALRVHQARVATAPKFTPTGECINPLCGEPLDPPQLFCGPKCAQEHARRLK